MAFREDLDALVLAVLQDGAAHGYEIAKRIKLRSDSVLSAGEGKLYPCLHKLEADGLISAEWVPQEGKPARKVYALTEGGRKELAKHMKRWESFSRAVGSVLKPGVSNA